MKKCRKCGEEKDIAQFSKNKNNPDGHAHWCKSCTSIRMKKYRESPEVKSREAKYQQGYMPEYLERPEVKERHTVSMRLSMRRRRALRRANGGHHTAEDIRKIGDLQKWKCWWCGKDCKNDYQKDHRVPLAKGGSDGTENLVVSCSHCNNKKRTKMPDEFAGRLL